MIINLYSARLSIDERNLLSIAYKNITNFLRSSWRVIDSYQKLPTKERQLALLRSQRDKVERELSTICSDIVSLLDKHLIPSARPGEEMVFYSKMYVIAYSSWRMPMANLLHQERGLLPVSR